MKDFSVKSCFRLHGVHRVSSRARFDGGGVEISAMLREVVNWRRILD